jgi:uncharacterized protein (TIGR02246 family)
MPVRDGPMPARSFTFGAPRPTVLATDPDRLREEQAMTDTPDNRTVMTKYVAALQAGDADAVRASFAEDASWTLRAADLPMSGTWTGRDTIMDEFFATAMANYEPGSIEIDVTAMLVDGDNVVLQWTTRARTRGDRPYENGCIGIFTVRDGKIHQVREYMDTLYVNDMFFRG